MSHTYVQQEVSDSLDFTYRSDFVRVSSNHTANDTPHLTPRYDSTTRDGKAQLVGLDGWRISGNNSYKANPVVTTNNANQMLYCSSFGMAKQLMCQPITNGIVKFEKAVSDLFRAAETKRTSDARPYGAAAEFPSSHSGPPHP